MSSGFITEAEIEERRRIRQEEWEKVRTPDQPIGKNRFHVIYNVHTITRMENTTSFIVILQRRQKKNTTIVLYSNV